jgi:endonuclease/exonuclease/phosphatase family metal-dependent hydrolase
VTELRTRCVHTQIIVIVQEALRTGPQVPATTPENVHAPRRESSDRGAVPDIVDVAERLGMWLAYVPSMRNGRDEREDRGCAILSTMPLVDPIAIELPWVAQRRVAVAVTTKPAPPLPAIRIVSVHLDNRPGRREQSDALARWLGASGDEEIPTIIGADLNTWFGSGEETVHQIARVVPLAPGCDERPTFRFGRRLDYLFTSATNVISCEVVEETYGSDHHPLIMEIGELVNW